MKTKAALITILIIVCAASIVLAKDDYKNHPGYVDFDMMGVFGEMDASVEVFLKGSLLKIVAGATRDEDPELSQMIENLKFVHVQVFPLDEDVYGKVEEKVNQVSKRLEKSGWEIMVRVRDRSEDEQVNVYFLPTRNDEIISGLVVMVIDDMDEAVFVNIVGDLDPAQIGRLGEKFDIHGIDNIDWDEDWDHKTIKKTKRYHHDDDDDDDD
jgi:hypothetical protein